MRLMHNPVSRIVAVGVLIVAACCATEGHAQEFAGADQRMQQAGQSYRRGDLAGALEHWRAGQELFEAAGDRAGQIECLRQRSVALRAMGGFSLALDRLSEAFQLAAPMGDPLCLMVLYEDLGVLLTMADGFGGSQTDQGRVRAIAGIDDDGSVPDARYFLEEKSLVIAQEQGEIDAAASIHNNLGNLHSSRASYPEAIVSYRAAAQMAGEVGDLDLTALAAVNAAMAITAALDPLNAQVAAGASKPRFDDADLVDVIRAARLSVDQLEPSHQKSLLLSCLGHVQSQLLARASIDHKPTRLAPTSPASIDRSRWLLGSFDCYQAGLAISRLLKDHRGQCYALEGLAGLYEAQGRYEEALEAAGRAAGFVSRSGLTNAAYRLQWQRGRLLRALGRRDEAIIAYRKAAGTLRDVQPQLNFGLGNRFPDPDPGSSFRRGVGPLLYQLAELLLQAAGDAQGQPPEAAQALMREAIGALEQLKTVELADYFQDECIQPGRRIEGVAADTAIVYHVPLEDRTEILVDIRGRLFRRSAPVGKEQLRTVVNQFRLELESTIHLHHNQLGLARDLYQWLIAPIGSLLASEGVETLVFVPDAPLRSIPMAALHDGQRYLIERYAMAVTPGLTLTTPKPLEEVRIRPLACGLTVLGSAQPLPHVATELHQLGEFFEQASILMDEQFTLSGIEQQVRENPFSVVHIASHGAFRGRRSDTYLLVYSRDRQAHSGRMTLTDLQRLIQLARYRDQPIELLTLSACETAQGDEDAALGLAGIALKSGARSALATLWSVHDQSTALLMAKFYQLIRDQPGITKAKALQQAQLSLMNNDQYDYRDPYFWSPFLVIGNWQ